MGTIPSVPSCNAEGEFCSALPLVPVGGALVVTDQSTECNKKLDGVGVPLQVPDGVRMADGSPDNPIKFPNIQTLDPDAQGAQPSFPFVIVMNKSGDFFALRAVEENKRYIFTSKNGSFVLEES